MPTSGKTRFTLNKLIDHAIRRCQIPGQGITSEQQQIAKECLTLVLTTLQNEKMTLWCQESIMVPLYEHEEKVTLPDGTIDVLSAFYRTLPRNGDSYNSAEGIAANVGDGDLVTSCDQVSINGNIQVQYFNRVPIAIVGVIPNGDQYYNLVFEASDDGISWTTIYTVPVPDGENATLYEDAKWAWYEMPSPANALFFRVRETSGGVLKLREFVTASQPNDILMARLNRTQYTYLPNKKFEGSRPLQYWLKRDLDAPTMYLWPRPSHADTLNCLNIWRRRYIYDLGNFNAQVEIPLRWYDAICWRLAESAAAELPNVPPDALERATKKAAMGFQAPYAEERDDSPVVFRPNLRPYTR